MFKFTLKAWTSALVMGVCALNMPAQAQSSQATTNPEIATFTSHMRTQIQRLRSRHASATAGQTLVNRAQLIRVFDRNGYQAIWTSNQGWNRNAQGMLQYLRELPRHGLDPRLYHFTTLLELSNQNTLASRIHSELLLSDALVSLEVDLTRGASSRYAGSAKAQQLLLRLKPSDDPSQEFNALLPQHSDYWRLSAALKNLMENEADIQAPKLTGSDFLKAGTRGPEVQRLRERLRAIGFSSAETQSDLFDDHLRQALVDFQISRGLDADGIVGDSTREALNLTVAEKVATVSANLERWRQQSGSYGDSYIRVNIAAQTLDYIHQGELALHMPVIVGRVDRPTPNTHSAIRELVFNPYWEVPTRIAVRDKLPMIRKNPEYLTQKNFILRESWAPDAAVLDPSNIDWSKVHAGNFRFRLSQKPGADNALGAVKFLFPNDHAVYLHDTPTRHLFTESQRLFSSGCVRLSRPMELAEMLLRNDGTPKPAMNRPAADARVRLKNAVPVNLEYWTAWVDRQGELQIRSDIYQRDQSVLSALHQSGAMTSPQELISLAQTQPYQLAAYQ